jgi:ribulose 1,5-bisphosphate carboxylase large subunit-like protein
MPTYISTGAATSWYGSSVSTDLGATWTNIDTIVQHTAFGAYDVDNIYSGSFNALDASFNNVGGIFKLADLLSVNNLDAPKAEVSTYPNPSNGIVNMNFKAGKQVDILATVVNMIGEKVYSEKFSNVTMFRHSFDFSWLPKGVYMLNLEYGGAQTTQKLVIQ